MTIVRTTQFGVIAAAACVAGVWLAAQSPLAAAQSALPKPNAKAVWSYLEKQKYRSTYKFFPGKKALYKGLAPHGMLLTTYVNGPAHEALSAGANTLPAGSMIVKENYTPKGELAAITVMYKSQGYDPKHNDWYWLKRAADGKVEASGKVAGCIACHTPSPRDFILTPLP